METGIVDRYLELGLRLGRHVDGFVDAYYGPAGAAARVEAEPVLSPAELRADAGRLLADLDGGAGADEVDPGRRRWIRAQVARPPHQRHQAVGCRCRLPRRGRALLRGPPGIGPRGRVRGRPPQARRGPARRRRPARPVHRLARGARRAAGQAGGRHPGRWPTTCGSARSASSACPTASTSSGSSRPTSRGQASTTTRAGCAAASPSTSTCPCCRSRSATWWRTRPIPATTPSTPARRQGWSAGATGRRRRSSSSARPSARWPRAWPTWARRSRSGRRPEPVVADHLRPLGIRYDADVAAAVAEAGEALSWVRSNAAIGLHDRGWTIDDTVGYLERWALLPRNRAREGGVVPDRPDLARRTATATRRACACAGRT